MNVTISENDMRTAANALRLSIGIYKEDAEKAKACGEQRIADQFTKQAEEAMQLAAWFEDRADAE